ncbi:MAG: EAL domain-containing protein [Actinobacteria bacterium]|nr:EAL domain-containing protein [Actinomycetota bacterium]
MKSPTDSTEVAAVGPVVGAVRAAWSSMGLGSVSEKRRLVDFELKVGNSRLTAWFQQYKTPANGTCEGELLSRIEPVAVPEEFFANLDISDQFRVLEWHLDIADAIATDYPIRVSINLHNSLVADKADRVWFLEHVASCSTPVTFEFTETHPLPPVGEANRLLRDIRERGHRSALDDFGTGLNRSSLLTHYDFDVIKIDRSLHVGVEADPARSRSLKLVFDIIELLGKAHVVEGVETDAAHEALLEIGFSTFQGFLFHRPEPVAEYLATSSRRGIA